MVNGTATRVESGKGAAVVDLSEPTGASLGVNSDIGRAELQRGVQFNEQQQVAPSRDYSADPSIKDGIKNAARIDQTRLSHTPVFRSETFHPGGLTVGSPRPRFSPIYVEPKPSWLESAFNFLGEMTGVSDLVMGAVEGFADGNWSRFFKGAKTFGMLVLEATPIGAALSVGWSLLSGDWTSAAIGLGVLGASLVGAGLLAKAGLRGAQSILKTGAKEFLETAGKDIGAKLAEDIVGRIGLDAIKETASKIAEEGALKCARQLFSPEEIARLAKGLASPAELESLSAKLSPKALGEFVKDEAKTATKKMLEENGLAEMVKDSVKGMFKNAESKSAKDLAKDLAGMGIKDPDHALKLAKDMKRIIANGPDAEAKEAMAKILTKEISEPISARLEKEMEESFRSQMTKMLSGELKSEDSQALNKLVAHQAEKRGISQEKVISEYVDESWKAAREGIREAVEEVVGKAVREAIDEIFKRMSFDLPAAGARENGKLKRGMETAVADVPEREALRREHSERSAKPLVDIAAQQVRTQLVLRDGVQFVVTSVLDDPQTDVWRTISERRVDSGDSKTDIGKPRAA